MFVIDTCSIPMFILFYNRYRHMQYSKVSMLYVHYRHLQYSNDSIALCSLSTQTVSVFFLSLRYKLYFYPSVLEAVWATPTPAILVQVPVISLSSHYSCNNAPWRCYYRVFVFMIIFCKRTSWQEKWTKRTPFHCNEASTMFNARQVSFHRGNYWRRSGANVALTNVKKH